eukprot:Sspe_Gene.36997::Locus_17872_Transcript_1_1_Confidence_1.000_Length_1637::g.36997::m.36997
MGRPPCPPTDPTPAVVVNGRPDDYIDTSNLTYPAEYFAAAAVCSLLGCLGACAVLSVKNSPHTRAGSSLGCAVLFVVLSATCLSLLGLTLAEPPQECAEGYVPSGTGMCCPVSCMGSDKSTWVYPSSRVARCIIAASLGAVFLFLSATCYCLHRELHAKAKAKALESCLEAHIPQGHLLSPHLLPL